MRLIDADILEEFIDSKFVVSWKHDYDGGFKDACTAILNAIKESPSIDIVRCRECRWYSERENCLFSTAEVDADDFCSYGERSSE